MKTYTDINQAKKLAEILPIESADMHYNNVSIKGINYVDEHRAELMEYNRAIKVLSKYTINPLFEVVPCWSLATLIELIPVTAEYNDMFVRLRMDKGHAGHAKYAMWYDDLQTNLCTDIEVEAENFIDVCVSMIIKLHEQKLL